MLIRQQKEETVPLDSGCRRGRLNSEDGVSCRDRGIPILQWEPQVCVQMTKQVVEQVTIVIAEDHKNSRDQASVRPR